MNMEGVREMGARLVLLAALAGLIASATSSGWMGAAGSNFKICPPENISITPGRSTHPRIAVDGSGAIFVAWEEDDLSNREIYLTRLSFNPACFSPPEDEPISPVQERLEPVNVSDNSGDSRSPDLAMMGRGSGFVVWQDTTVTEENPHGKEAILLRWFTTGDRGQLELWDIFNLSEQPRAEAEAPRIMVDEFGRSFVAWQQAIPDSPAEIIMRTSLPYSPKVNVSQSPIYNSQAPDLAVTPDSSQIFIVWQERLAANWEIFISSSTNAEERFIRPEFAAPNNISNTPGDSEEPAIVAIDGLEQLVVWSDSTPGDYDIFFRRSTEGFKPHFNISKNCPQGSEWDSRQPTIVLDGSNNILVAWQEDVQGNREVFFATSDFRGEEPYGCLNISAEIEFPAGNLPPQPSPYASSLPALATDRSGNIFIVWEEQVGPDEQDTEIYFTALKR